MGDQRDVAQRANERRRALEAGLRRIADGDVPGVQFAENDLIAAFARDVLAGASSEVELRDRATAPIALKSVQNALRLFDDGHVTLARTELATAQAELEAQAAAWGAIRLMLDDEAHVCTCDHVEGRPELAGCSKGMDSRCRFEAALRTMVGLDG